MPDHVPPRALGHLQAAIDHLKLAQHYVEKATPKTYHVLEGEIKKAITSSQLAHECAYVINHDDAPTDLKDVAADRTPITGEGYEVVHLGKDYFRDLPEYSTSIPTGVTIGKRWKRRIPAVPNEPGWWLMGEFVAVKGRTDVADITWKRVEII